MSWYINVKAAQQYKIEQAAIQALLSKGENPFDPTIPTDQTGGADPTGGTRQIDPTKYYNIQSDDTSAFTWAYLNQCGMVFLDYKPLEGGFPFRHSEKAPFSPFNSENPFTLDNLLLIASFSKLAKEPKLLAGVLQEYIKSQTKIAEAISDMGNQSWVASANATMLLGGFLHSRGLLDDAAYLRTASHVKGGFGQVLLKEAALGALSGLSSLVKNVAGAVKPTGET